MSTIPMGKQKRMAGRHVSSFAKNSTIVTTKNLPTKVQKLGKEIAKVKRAIKDDNEVKSFDGRVLALTAVGWDFSAVFNLFAPAQSLAGMLATAGGRVGDKVRITGMDLRYKVVNTSTTALSQVRVVVFIDKDNALGLTSVLDSATIINTIQAPYAFYLRTNRDKFRVLYDKTHLLDVTESSQDFVRQNFKLNLPVVFAAGSTSITNNAIKIAFISDQLVGTSTVFYNYASRIYYTDA